MPTAYHGYEQDFLDTRIFMECTSLQVSHTHIVNAPYFQAGLTIFGNCRLGSIRKSSAGPENVLEILTAPSNFLMG